VSSPSTSQPRSAPPWPPERQAGGTTTWHSSGTGASPSAAAGTARACPSRSGRVARTGWFPMLTAPGWLAGRLPGARAHLLPGEGHLTLAVTAFGEILADLLDLAGLRAAGGQPA